MQTAGKYGTFRSYDLNYRSKVEPDKTKPAQQPQDRLPCRVSRRQPGRLFDALGYETRKVGKEEPMEVFMAAYTDMLHKSRRIIPT